MTTNKRKGRGGEEAPVSTPAQQDEADIVAEVGATPANDGSGDLLADEAKVLEAGAVDAESIRENRRVEEIVNKKRAGQAGVQFNSDNLLEKYEGVIKYWPPNTLDILVKRVTGTPVEWVIQSRPRSGADLYAAILARHGRCEEAEYDVRFRDVSDKQRRGTGRITMPDTRETPPVPQPPQGQPPMNPFNPYGQAPPAAPTVQVVPQPVDPVAMMRSMFEMIQQMQRPPAQQPTVPQPTPAPPPASFPGQSTDPLAMMRAMFEMFQQMQQPAPAAQTQTPPSQQPQQQPTPPPSTDPMAMMRAMFEMFQQTQLASSSPAPSSPQQPTPPPSTDPMAMMRTMFEMFQKMQPQQQQPVASPPPQQQPPPVQAPPGMFHVPGFGFVPAERLFQVLSGAPAQQGPQGPYRSSPYGASRPPYGEQPPYGERPPPYGERPPYGQPPARPKTAAEEFRDAVGIVQTAVEIADRFRPQAPAVSEPERERDSDDNPVKVVEVGDFKFVVDKKDGSARKWETGVANMGNVLKWLAEQRESIQKASAERESRQPRQQQTLPPGYVEVTPGYKPPPGYVAIPVDQLPQPPENMPPPIAQQEEEAPRRREWGMPPMPGGGE